MSGSLLNYLKYYWNFPMLECIKKLNNINTYLVVALLLLAMVISLYFI